jgi:hypothetical protein
MRVSYLLQQNAFPAGSTELRLDEKELSDVQIVQKGKQAAANFTLVRMVGCLIEAPGKSWTLSRASDPAVTKDETSTAAALKTAAKALWAHKHSNL